MDLDMDLDVDLDMDLDIHMDLDMCLDMDLYMKWHSRGVPSQQMRQGSIQMAFQMRQGSIQTANGRSRSAEVRFFTRLNQKYCFFKRTDEWPGAEVWFFIRMDY